MKKVVIYTDGASHGNPGPGGWGAVLMYKDKRKEISGGYRHTTNNRMEIMGVIKALELLGEKCDIDIYTDSNLLVDTIEKGWAKKWRANGWKRNKKDKAKNADLLKVLLNLLDRHEAKFHWVKGHAGNPLNERCDRLATDAAFQPNLPADEVYESEN